MDTIVLAVLGGLLVLLLVALLAARVGRRRARSRVASLSRDLVEVRTARDAAVAGEREAIWAMGIAAERLSDAEAAAVATLERLDVLEADLDDMRSRLVAADADLTSARRDADEARTEVARLEVEIAAGARSPSADSDAMLASLVADLDAERSIVAELRSQVHVMTSRDDSSYRDRLVASEARRRDLEDRLASLNAVRSAEQRTAADRIAGLERLHARIGDHEDRIEELESDLKSAEEARDDALEESSRLQVEIVRLKGELNDARRRLEVLEQHGNALMEARAQIEELEARLERTTNREGEVERLRKALEAERSRAERISRRATEISHDTTYAMWDRVVRERVDAAVQRDTDRLTAHIEHLRAVVAEKEERLRTLISGGADPAASRDDLPPITTIRGIGVKIAGILADRGIATIPDIAALTDEDVDALAMEMPIYPGRIRDDDWVGQAKALLEATHRSPEPESAGPPPVTAIKGIGPAIASILAERGITTMADIAALTDREIEDLGDEMPVYPGRIRDDDWVGQARSFL